MTSVVHTISFRKVGIYMRDFDDELEYRRALRQKYFEDPNYRRWSDIVPNGIDGRPYMNWRDDRLFDYLITGQTERSNLSTIQDHLRDSHKLPINWYNFYAYFDERLNDPNNELTDELISISLGSHVEQHLTVKDLLNQYRDEIFGSYDMI